MLLTKWFMKIFYTTPDQLHILDNIRHYSKAAMTPLQRLEHSLHPFVDFVVMPIFALANAGITFSNSFFDDLGSNISLGVIFGLVLGKFIGIVGFSKILIKLNLATLPEDVNWRQIYGVAMLGGIGFTMSLFVPNLSILKTGKAKAIRFSTLESICKALDCQPADILEYKNDDVKTTNR